MKMGKVRRAWNVHLGDGLCQMKFTVDLKIWSGIVTQAESDGPWAKGKYVLEPDLSKEKEVEERETETTESMYTPNAMC